MHYQIAKALLLVFAFSAVNSCNRFRLHRCVLEFKKLMVEFSKAQSPDGYQPYCRHLISETDHCSMSLLEECKDQWNSLELRLIGIIQAQIYMCHNLPIYLEHLDCFQNDTVIRKVNDCIFNEMHYTEHYNYICNHLEDDVHCVKVVVTDLCESEEAGMIQHNFLRIRFEPILIYYNCIEGFDIQTPSPEITTSEGVIDNECIFLLHKKFELKALIEQRKVLSSTYIENICGDIHKSCEHQKQTNDTRIPAVYNATKYICQHSDDYIKYAECYAGLDIPSIQECMGNNFNFSSQTYQCQHCSSSEDFQCLYEYISHACGSPEAGRFYYYYYRNQTNEYYIDPLASKKIEASGSSPFPLILLVIVGSVLLVAVLVGVSVFICKRRSKKVPRGSQPTPAHENPSYGISPAFGPRETHGCNPGLNNGVNPTLADGIIGVNENIYAEIPEVVRTEPEVIVKSDTVAANFTHNIP